MSDTVTAVPDRGLTAEKQVGLALGGGGARGLAHLGVLQVLEEERLRPAFLAGTSIGGLVAALFASARPAAEIISIARGFQFPRRFIPGRILAWHEIFPSAVPFLEGLTFEDLTTPLAISAVDLQQGEEVVLHTGPVLPAVRATCAVPGIVSPERLDGRYLIDGGVLNILPVDLAWSWDPDVVIAVNILATPSELTHLDSAYSRIATGLGRILPNPVTAQLAFEIATRAVEVALDRQRVLAVAMTGPEVLIDIDLGDVSLRDFHRLDEVVELGREATKAALPRIRGALARLPGSAARTGGRFSLHIDPVCRMVVSPGRARARLEHDGANYYFCSVNCRDSFELHAERYLKMRSIRHARGAARDVSPGQRTR